MSSTDDHYFAAKSRACSPDEAARVRLAANRATPPEILYYFAKDPAVTVRAAVATNDEAPIPAAHVLARDGDARVRGLIARRLGSLAPGLTGQELEGLRRGTYHALVKLVADESARVREALCDVLKDMPDAPRELVLALAHDTAVSVCEPIISLSPILTPDDLLGLLTAPPHPAAAVWIARRPGLSAAVCDAIAATADVAAVRALLANHSANIREATLDALIAQAVERVEWLEPLVRRPKLSPGTAKRLSEIVTGHLLERLAARADLDPALAHELRRRLDKRLAAVCAHSAEGASALNGAVPVARNGPVSEAELLEALQRGEIRLAAGLLATAARVPVSVVERAASLRSAKGLVSLLWKAGFGMNTARALQYTLGRITPDAVLGPGPGDTFPLSIEEMRWQLEFLGRGSR